MGFVNDLIAPAFPADKAMPDVAAQTISFDLPCSICAYNLRGLSLDGDCPECGQRVAASFRGDFLKNANPLWIARVHVGFNILMWVLVVGSSLLLIQHLLAVVAPPQYFSNPTDWWHRINRFLLHIKYALPSLTWLAIWLVTIPESAGTDDATSLRRSVRVLVTMSLALSLLPSLLLYGRLFQWLTATDGVSAGVLIFLFYLYLKRLAQRVPDPWALSAVPLVMYGLSISTLLYHIAPLLVSSAGVLRAQPTSPRNDLPVIIPALACLIFGIYAVMLVLHFSRTLRRVAVEVRDNWKSTAADLQPA